MNNDTTRRDYEAPEAQIKGQIEHYESVAKAARADIARSMALAEKSDVLAQRYRDALAKLSAS